MTIIYSIIFFSFLFSKTRNKKYYSNNSFVFQVGEIYPCYVHKSLLDDAANDNEKINLKHAAQWKKPSKRKAIIWLFTGSTVTAIEIIIFIIAILLYYRE